MNEEVVSLKKQERKIMENIIKKNARNIKTTNFKEYTFRWGKLIGHKRKNNIIFMYHKDTLKEIYVYNGQQFNNVIDCSIYYDQCNQ